MQDNPIFTVESTLDPGEQYYSELLTMMTGTVVSILPLIALFLLAQDFFIKGITLSGLKLYK